MQRIVVKDEDEPEEPAPEPTPRAAPQPPPQQPFVERRRADRRGMDALRAEALRSLISRVEDRNFGGLRNEVSWSSRIKLSRVALLAVAIVAGGLAAFLATQREVPVTAPSEPVVEVVAAPTSEVLVATSELSAGERLTAGTLAWEEWPVSAVSPHYITSDAVPDAVVEMSGTVARSGFLPGEPIRTDKLVETSGGYLSALLGGGKRAVSVMVSAEAASGGFVAPNDHVDVLMTRESDIGRDSSTILHNVRVLAINSRLGGTEVPPDEAAQSDVFTGTAIATLELDPTQAEVITAASTMGQLSLVLRSAVDSAEPDSADRRAANQVIRLTSPFWQQ